MNFQRYEWMIPKVTPLISTVDFFSGVVSSVEGEET